MRRKDRKQLELEKISLEIVELKKSWWKKVEYLRIIIPSLLALISILLAFNSGLVDLSKKELEIEKKQLVYDISKFNDRKDSLYSEYLIVLSHYDSTRLQLEGVTLLRDSLVAELQDTRSLIESTSNELGQTKRQEFLLRRQRHVDRITRAVEMVNGTLFLKYGELRDKVVRDYWGIESDEEIVETYAQIMQDSGWVDLDRDAALAKMAAGDQRALRQNETHIVDALVTQRDSILLRMIKQSDLQQFNGYVQVWSNTPSPPYILPMSEVANPGPDFDELSQMMERVLLHVAVKNE